MCLTEIVILSTKWYMTLFYIYSRLETVLFWLSNAYCKGTKQEEDQTVLHYCMRHHRWTPGWRQHLKKPHVTKAAIGIYAILIYFIKLSQQYKADIRAGCLSRLTCHRSLRGIEGVIIFRVYERCLWEVVIYGLPKGKHFDSSYWLQKVFTN